MSTRAGPLAVVFATVLVAAGEPVRAQQSAGPLLVLEDSVILRETQDAYVGKPVGDRS